MGKKEIKRARKQVFMYRTHPPGQKVDSQSHKDVFAGCPAQVAPSSGCAHEGAGSGTVKSSTVR